VLRVALYCEGAGESGGSGYGVRVGDVLADEQLGAAHVLVRSALQFVDARRGAELQFVEPQRTASGRVVGGQLLLPKTLRKVLSWADAKRAPELAVVLVDEDGQSDRLSVLKRTVQGLHHPMAAIGVAVREFESWLIADHRALARVTGQRIDNAFDVEALRPGEAKQHLNDVAASLRDERGVAAAHRRIAEQLDLAELKSRSKSFSRFVDEARECLARTP
jgi:hypothetical protein